MYAFKGNQQYTITEAEKAAYVAQGFDILNEQGVVIENGAGKTVPFAKFKALQDELAAAQAQIQSMQDAAPTPKLKDALARIKELEAALAAATETPKEG